LPKAKSGNCALKNKIIESKWVNEKRTDIKYRQYQLFYPIYVYFHALGFVSPVIDVVSKINNSRR